MSESPNVLVATFFSYQAKVNTKAKECHEVSESQKNCLTEYLTRKTALESMDPSQVCITAGSKLKSL